LFVGSGRIGWFLSFFDELLHEFVVGIEGNLLLLDLEVFGSGCGLSLVGHV